MDTDGESNSNPDINTLLNNLQDRANRLLKDIKQYQACLQSHQKQKEVEVRTFIRHAESEIKTLLALSSNEPGLHGQGSLLTEFEIEELELKRLHTLRSSNLSFYEAVWDVARQCRGIVALGKRVSCGVSATATVADRGIGSDNAPDNRRKREKKSAVVDVIASDGLEWIKVSTNTERRLLFEMAKEGWEGYGDESDSEPSESNGMLKQEEPVQLGLVKLSKTLYAASQETRIRFRHPSVRLVLPNVHEGKFDDIDAMIADIRSIGVQVTCGSNSSSSSSKTCTDSNCLPTSLRNLSLNLNGDSHQDPDDLTQLLPSPSVFSPPPTPILNIDCTILLALISDISHIPESDLPPYPDNLSGVYHQTILRQIRTENTSPLLPTELYPLLSNKRLVCTTHATQRMREIVQTMGTASESKRAAIFLGEKSFANTDPTGLRAALQESSQHAVPPGLGLPFHIVDPDIPADSRDTDGPTSRTSTLSAQDLHVMTQISRKMRLSTINESVFLYGWQKGVVTVTSNRVIAHGLIRSINEVLDEKEKSEERDRDDVDGGDAGRDSGVGFRGPLIYVCETARSLIGKEKQGRQVV